MGAFHPKQYFDHGENFIDVEPCIIIVLSFSFGQEKLAFKFCFLFTDINDDIFLVSPGVFVWGSHDILEE